MLTCLDDRLGAKAKISDDPALVERIAASVAFLKAKLHTSIYGVNTGFGGSADTRTDAPNSLQISLLEHQLAGVLPRPPVASSPLVFDVTDAAALAMPEAIVRGAMLIRINSLVRCAVSACLHPRR